MFVMKSVLRSPRYLTCSTGSDYPVQTRSFLGMRDGPVELDLHTSFATADNPEQNYVGCEFDYHMTIKLEPVD